MENSPNIPNNKNPITPVAPPPLSLSLSPPSFFLPPAILLQVFSFLNENKKKEVGPRERVAQSARAFAP